jgi:mRNA-degrading endonuclease toxin of MazEF toxin-antitoxin module
VPVPRGKKLTGVILSHQFRTVDWIARNAQFHSKANEDLMHEVLGRIEAILASENS